MAMWRRKGLAVAVAVAMGAAGGVAAWAEEDGTLGMEGEQLVETGFPAEMAEEAGASAASWVEQAESIQEAIEEQTITPEDAEDSSAEAEEPVTEDPASGGDESISDFDGFYDGSGGWDSIPSYGGEDFSSYWVDTSYWEALSRGEDVADFGFGEPDPSQPRPRSPEEMRQERQARRDADKASLTQQKNLLAQQMAILNNLTRNGTDFRVGNKEEYLQKRQELRDTEFQIKVIDLQSQLDNQMPQEARQQLIDNFNKEVARDYLSNKIAYLTFVLGSVIPRLPRNSPFAEKEYQLRKLRVESDLQKAQRDLQDIGGGGEGR